MTVDEVKARFVGKCSEPQVLEVEKGSAKRYAVAVDDLNPLYLDEECARASRYGAILAPPGFFGWPVLEPSPRFPKILEEILEALRECGYPDILDGGADYEFLLPVRAGDTLVSTRTVTGLSARGGASGRQMAFMAIESTYVNQHGRLVAKVRQTLIALTPVKAG